MIQHVLVVATEPAIRDQSVPFLQRKNIKLHSVTSGRDALAIILETRCVLVIVQYPLPDLPFDEFIAALAGPDSRCQKAAVLAVARPSDWASVRSYVGCGVDRLVNLEWSGSELPAAAAALLILRQRRRLRARASLDVVLGKGSACERCQTRDLSTTGMNLVGANLRPPGTRFDFELTLGDEFVQVRGEAEVLRHTREGAQTGLATRFVSLADDGARQLASFLSWQKAGSC